MPEFLGRPNVPNALANSLVQLAAAEDDPLAAGLRAVGGLADKYTDYQTKMKMLEKHSELQEQAADKQHGRAKELKKMDMDAHIFEKLLSNDRIIGGLMGDKGMSSADADGLLAGVQTPGKLVEGDFGKRPTTGKDVEGQPLSAFGVNIPGDPHMTPSKEKVKVDKAMAKRYKLPDTVIGKTLTMDQVVGLTRSEGGRGSGSGRDPDRLKLAEQIVNRNPDMIEADLPTRMAAIDAAYDALATIKSGGNVPEPPPKAAPPKKKGTSIFGFTFGGDAPASAKTAPATPGDEEAIRAEYQAGKLTKDQAREKIKALRSSVAKK